MEDKMVIQKIDDDVLYGILLDSIPECSLEKGECNDNSYFKLRVVKQ
jgi:hypothetical protein